MREFFVGLYQKAAGVLAGTGISQVFPFTIVNRMVLSRLRSGRAEVDGHVMFLDPLDSLNLSVCGAFEPFETEVVKRCVRPGNVVLDIGANIGYYTLLFARLVGESGAVHAFEPVPDNFELLTKNVEANGYRNVSPVQAAVSDTAGTVKIFLSDSDQVDHRIYESGEARSSIDVDCLRIDDYLDAHPGPVSFVKMDIQGAEASAVRGMTRLLSGDAPLIIVSEFWPYGFRNAGEDPKTFLALLAANRFTVMEIDERAKRVTPASPDELLRKHPPEKQGFANLLCYRGPAPDLSSLA